jgi:hypothetical protein
MPIHLSFWYRAVDSVVGFGFIGWLAAILLAYLDIG